MRQDLVAGLTVAIVSLPLAITFAIACGASPESGVYATIIGGFVASLFGGTNFLISAPATVLLITSMNTANQYGFEGLFLATFMAGVCLIIAGFLKAGSIIDFIPYSVTLGFASGIGIMIFTMQLKDCLGLTVLSNADNSANHILNHWTYYLNHIAQIRPVTAIVSVCAVIAILCYRKLYCKWPKLKKISVFALVIFVFSIINYCFNLDLPTIGQKYGAVSRIPPTPHMPFWSLSQIVTLMPNALTLAFLTGINALLSSAVTYEITNKKHKPQMELIAQGLANITSAIFGGLPITATMSRSGTNIKSNARTPLAGIFHCAFILLFVNFFSKMLGWIPIPLLAAILILIAFDTSQVKKFYSQLHMPHGEYLVLLSTFFLAICVDIAVGILAGVAITAIMFIREMGEVTRITPEIRSLEPTHEVPEEINIYHIDGPFFFGAASRIKNILDQNKPNERVAILNLQNVPLIDSTGTWILRQFIRSCTKRGTLLIVANSNPNTEDFISKIGVTRKRKYLVTKNLEEAIEKARAELKGEQ